MKSRLRSGLAAGLLGLAALAGTAHAAGPTVTVRVEGEHGTLLDRTRVTLSGNPVPGGSGCGPTSAGAALDQATNGNWDRSAFATTIMGESHDFSRTDYWAEWIDTGAGYKRGGGLCADEMHEGDELLMLVDMPPYGEGSTTEVPLSLRGVPATVTVGTSVTVTVVGAVTSTAYGDPGDGTDAPVAGATVSAGAAGAVTGADGRTTLRFETPGVVTLRATKAGDVPSAGVPVAVGTAPVAPQSPAVPDTEPPRATIEGIRYKHRYARRHAPRELHGTVTPDPSGLRAVKLRLTRSHGGRCWMYSGHSERFKARACGKRAWFRIGDRQDWSYLLPARLRPGRYVLDVTAIDRAGNRDVIARPRTRTVFFVG